MDSSSKDVRRWDEWNTFSVFADNLPEAVTLGWLWKVFSSMGEVVDVYLSRKRRANNPLRFAFIRYKTRNEALRAIEQYDRWIVWGCEIKVVESRYKRRIEGPNRKAQEEERRNESGEGDTKNSEELKVDDDMLHKLQRSMIGETMHPFEFEELKKEVLKEWSNIQEVRMMGSMKLLLVFDSEEHMMEACKSPNIWKYFLAVRSWTKGESNRLRRCWIEVVGLPLHEWTNENMRKIGEVWGRVIKVVRDDVSQFSSFKMLVDVNVGPMIQSFADIVIDEDTF
ncbi:hypothetical protein PIB30_017502 [Stylosanthes scabra]|uniref:RRM domain-containing protein n=1 Tax=Stylosanthes scabra TaxID=79078 RepID=A0ABU6Q8B8_9FABA|nr:hypothetical protein [Stylosanthes scabra]